MGNRFRLNFLGLPLDLANPVERLAVLRQRFKDLKADLEMIVT